MATQGQHPISIRFKLERRFYEPILLETVLRKSQHAGFSGPQREPNTHVDSTDVAEETFHCFVNRLAQVCDNKKGGETVSAIAVLAEADGVHYIVGSNKRKPAELEHVQAYVYELFRLVGPSQTSSLTGTKLKSVLLRHVLQFTKPRIKFYIKQIAKNLDLCFEDHKRRYPPGSRNGPSDAGPNLRSHLINPLQEMTQFQTEDESNSSDQAYFEACEKLILWIHDLFEHQQLMDLISQQARDGRIDRSEPWIELKHHLGRLRSYELAINTIIRMSRQFKELFQDVKVTVIDSERAIPHILNKKQTTASGIIGRMVAKDLVAEWRAKLEEFQRFGLDNDIEYGLANESHMCMVHAEMLVLNYIQRREKGDLTRFWNNWKYIGSSKPTCRLCSYYFSVHPSRVMVRQTHGNLYSNWRVPDVFSRTEEEARDRILLNIIDRVRQDVMRLIEDRRPLGRTHDSNTRSEMPQGLKSGMTDSASINDLESRFGGLDIASQRSAASAQPAATIAFLSRQQEGTRFEEREERNAPKREEEEDDIVFPWPRSSSRGTNIGLR